MSKTKRTRANPKEPSTKKDEQGQLPVDLEEMRNTLKQMVRARAPQLLEAILQDGEKGHVTSVKYAFDFAGLSSETGAKEEADDNALAMQLLQEMGLLTSPTLQEKPSPAPAMEQRGLIAEDNCHAISEQRPEDASTTVTKSGTDVFVPRVP